MSLEATHSATEAEILGRVIDPATPSLAPEAARSILALDFQPKDHERMQVLADKAGQGILTTEELAELESYNHVGHILALLQSKARVSLKRAGMAP